MCIRDSHEVLKIHSKIENGASRERVKPKIRHHFFEHGHPCVEPVAAEEQLADTDQNTGPDNLETPVGQRLPVEPANGGQLSKIRRKDIAKQNQRKMVQAKEDLSLIHI